MSRKAICSVRVPTFFLFLSRKLRMLLFFTKVAEDKWHFGCYSYYFYFSADVAVRSFLGQGHANTTLRDHVFKTVTVYDETECGLLCSRDLRCKSLSAIIKTKFSVS